MRAERRGPRARRVDLSILHVPAIAAVLLWSAAAFGAVYAWAYEPLAVTCAAAGALMLARNRRHLRRSVIVAFASLIAAVLLQEVPLSPGLIARISPATDQFLSRNEIGFSLGLLTHPLSIDPQRTWTAVALFAAFGVFWIGMTVALTDSTVHRVAGAVIAIGVAIALAGIFTAGDVGGRVYGWWEPQSRAQPFGPFVNRNHFAGWMLMAIPLGAGYLLDLIAAARWRERSWRDRLVWLSRPHAGRALMTAFCLVVMTLSVCLSLSRSGIACLATALTVLAVLAAARLAHGWRRVLVPAVAGGLIVGCLAWVGTDVLVARFQVHGDASWAERQVAWHDARRIAGQFPWTGTGLNTFRSAMIVSQSDRLDQLFAQAHNDYLQLAAEGGALVGIPALALLGVFAMEVRRASRAGIHWIRVGAQVGLAAIALQELVDFSLQIPGNAALFCVVAAIAIYAPHPPVARRAAV